MSLLTYIPRQPLSNFVELLWLYRREAPTHGRERLLPMGSTELVVELGSDAPAALLCGPHSQPRVIDTSKPVLVAGVHFKPGGVFPFVKLPVNKLHNEQVSLADLWGAKAVELKERLLEASTPAAKFRVLKGALLSQYVRSEAPHRAVALALREFRGAPPAGAVSKVTARLGLSPRRFIQVFAEEVGMTPKLFCRIMRFQEALRRIEATPSPKWSATALACGYYDQSHFIHEFQEFSGLSPTAYLRVRTEHRNHVPLADEVKNFQYASRRRRQNSVDFR